MKLFQMKVYFGWDLLPGGSDDSVSCEVGRQVADLPELEDFLWKMATHFSFAWRIPQTESLIGLMIHRSAKELGCD